MKVFKQLYLLIWKNYTLQIRRPIATLFRLGLPVLFIFIILLIRVLRIKQEHIGATVWEDFSIQRIPYKHPGQGDWKIAYTPKNADVRSVMMQAASTLGLKAPVSISGYATEDAMVTELINDQEKQAGKWSYLCGVVFKGNLNNTHVTYTIRFPSSLRNSNSNKTSKFSGFQTGQGTWETKSVFPLTFDGVGPRGNKSKSGGPPDYFREGFLSVQLAVDSALIQYRGGRESFNMNASQIKMQRFPYPAYIRDPFVVVIQISLPLLLMLSMVYNALLVVKEVVYEKEKKLKESMKIMGLTGYLHWTAWFIKCFLLLLIPMALITVMLTVQFGSNGKMLQKSDPSLIFVYLVLYSMSSIMYGFMISTFFSRANTAAAGGGITWFLSYIPYFFLSMYYNLLNTPQKTISCIDFNVAMAFGAALIGKFEGQGIGVQWSNLFQGVTVDDSFSFGAVLLMMIIDILLYGLIMWYVEAVFPGEFGIPQPWYFPFKKSYWCGEKAEVLENDGYAKFQDENESSEDRPGTNTSFIEKEPMNLKAGIRIQNLRKEFSTDTGMKVAVNGLNLNMYEGQITALLGHNGAGKTTTISMVTGLFPPTTGTAIVNGYDITDNITGVRESLGICPQHNVLYDNLTVAEHLWFFAKLKGIDDKKQLDSEINRLISSVGLEDKRDVQTKKLSGGMKRKLSVGIALIGNSKVVILDEPTSGMDPAARRFTWDLLQKERKGRTILLTTHFMDEADLLGDRIAIMANGVLQCYGTSLFLKNKYGVGYHMVMVKSVDCDVTKVSSVVKRFVPSAKLENDIGLELSYILPSEESKNFETLFSFLEEHKDQLGISSYGASVTTLEEVFLRVKEEESLEEDAESLSNKLYRQLSSKSNASKKSTGESFQIDANGSSPPQSMPQGSNDYFGSSLRITGRKLFLQKWRAMFVKRVLNSKRYKRSIVTQLLMPGFWTLMAMVVAKTFPQPTDSPSITLDSTMFKENNVLFSDNESSGNSSSHWFFKEFVSQFRNTKTKPINITVPSKGNLTSYILERSAVDIGEFNLKNLIAVGSKESDNTFDVTAWFNNAAYHSSAAALNALSNARFRHVTGSTGSITTINHPLPRTTSQSIDDLSRNGVGFNVSFNILFGMAFLASSFVVFLVQERASKAKHLQFVSGVGPFCYWTASFAWDVINFLVPIAMIIIIFAAFDIPAYSGNRLGYVLLLLLLYGWAVIPLVYLSSFLFAVPSTAFIRLTIFNVITGLATLLTIFILSQPQLDLLDVASALKWVFLFLPNYALGQALNDIFTNHQYMELFNKGFDMCMKIKLPVPPAEKGKICRTFVLNALKNSPSQIVFQDNYLSWETPGIGRPLVFMAWEGLVFFLLVLFVEYGGLKLLIRPLRGSTRKVFEMMENGISVRTDDDVEAERRRVQLGDSKQDVLVLDNVTKYYGTVGKRFHAVDGLYLGMPKGECFGLLGLNGAGKTTTFKMITGDESVSDGTISVDGFDIEKHMTKVRQCIGYCPQFDALIDLLTGRELLTMFARLRGIPEDRIPRIVEELAVSLSFEAHIDKISKTYSGGNKRKLSTALALVGNPQIAFLDEPTSGMDPAARRKLWNALAKFRDQKGSIVITSHSMEECEALCTRLAIMVNGQFKCLGSPQHLKSKFGEGYTLLARVGGSSPDTTSLKNLINQNFPGSILKDEHQGFVNYQLKDASNSWARVFGLLESSKEKYNIEDYSVSQTTLEQVFLNFAKYQKEDERQVQVA